MSVPEIHSRASHMHRVHHFVWDALQYGHGEINAGKTCESLSMKKKR